jgi:hypothetical protein
MLTQCKLRVALLLLLLLSKLPPSLPQLSLFVGITIANIAVGVTMARRNAQEGESQTDLRKKSTTALKLRLIDVQQLVPVGDLSACKEQQAWH